MAQPCCTDLRGGLPRFSLFGERWRIVLLPHFCPRECARPGISVVKTVPNLHAFHYVLQFVVLRVVVAWRGLVIWNILCLFYIGKKDGGERALGNFDAFRKFFVSSCCALAKLKHVSSWNFAYTRGKRRAHVRFIQPAPSWRCSSAKLLRYKYLYDLKNAFWFVPKLHRLWRCHLSSCSFRERRCSHRPCGYSTFARKT